MAKLYRGRRTASGTEVTAGDKLLDPRTDLRDLSRTGFEWGYGGAGPMQLALAILADHYADDARALGDYKRYCELVIAEIADDQWTIDGDRISSSLDEVTDVPLTLEELMARIKGSN